MVIYNGQFKTLYSRYIDIDISAMYVLCYSRDLNCRSKRSEATSPPTVLGNGSHEARGNYEKGRIRQNRCTVDLTRHHKFQISLTQKASLGFALLSFSEIKTRKLKMNIST